MKKISLDEINHVYRKAMEHMKAINLLVEQGSAWFEHDNPMSLMHQDEKIPITKCRIEEVLVRRFRKMFVGRDVEFTVDYQGWFTPETFDARKFVERFFGEISEKIDEMILKTKMSKASCLITNTGMYYHTNPSVLAKDEVLDNLSRNSTFNGKVDIQRNRNGVGNGAPWQRTVSGYGIAEVNAFTWLSHFVTQSKIGALSPFEFRCPIEFNSVIPPLVQAHEYGPITVTTFFSTGGVKFTFKKTADCHRVIGVLCGAPVNLIYRKTQVNTDEIFSQMREEEAPRRVVKICKEVAVNANAR